MLLAGSTPVTALGLPWGPAPMLRARRVQTSGIKRRSDNEEGDVR